jgi:hypothetical protein
MATGEGTITFDFGTGGNVATVTGISATGVTSASRIEIYMDGTSSTTDHTAYEHAMVGLGGFVTLPISKGTNTFDAQASSSLVLTGTFLARYVWAT